MNTKTTNNTSPLTELILLLSANIVLNKGTLLSIPEITVIEKREQLFMKIDEAMNGSDATYNSSKAFVSAEMRADKNETLALRNSIGLKTCDSILYLNMKCKEVTGRRFLKNYYRVDDVKINQKNVDIFYSLIKEFDDALSLAIEEILSKVPKVPKN